jgi:ornithine--oxo-acid transaminase
VIGRHGIPLYDLTTKKPGFRVKDRKMNTQQHINMVDEFSAHNYKPIPVIIAEAEGVWVTDVEGNRYMDMLAAYSAVNFGHRHPEITQAAKEQLDRVTLTSRAFHAEPIGPFCKSLAELCDMESVLLMNTGAEGVETAVKCARKWGYEKKGITDGKAKVIVCDGNFHGRTTTIISFSSEESARTHFGPFTPGFEIIPYGDIDALENAIDENTAAFLVEPIQGEAGIIIPPANYLRKVREICTKHNVLMIADEIQTGLGRTGKTFCCEHEGVTPDIFILGKALGGGIMPVSAIVSSHEILSVFTPGTHGSTFGGNPLGAAIGIKVIELLNQGTYQKNSHELGRYLNQRLHDMNFPGVKEIRCKGLWAGIELNPDAGKARPYCDELKKHGVLCKDTRAQTIRLAPPLCITQEELDWALERIESVLKQQVTQPA